MPATYRYYCKDCGHYVYTSGTVKKCEKCGSTSLRKDLIKVGTKRVTRRCGSCGKRRRR